MSKVVHFELLYSENGNWIYYKLCETASKGESKMSQDVAEVTCTRCLGRLWRCGVSAALRGVP
jgi:hypothetical protein